MRKLTEKEERIVDAMVTELIKAKACFSKDEALKLIDSYMANPFVIFCRSGEAGIKAMRILQWGTRIDWTKMFKKQGGET